MSKHIRQATSKILQRPSQFNGFSFSEHKQFRNKLETALNHTSSQKPALPVKTKISLKLSEDSYFDKTFSSNIKAQSRLSDLNMLLTNFTTKPISMRKLTKSVI